MKLYSGPLSMFSMKAAIADRAAARQLELLSDEVYFPQVVQREAVRRGVAPLVHNLENAGRPVPAFLG